jgi:hypothetical protein
MITIELDKDEARILLMLLQGVKLNSQEQRELMSLEAQLEQGITHG